MQSKSLNNNYSILGDVNGNFRANGHIELYFPKLLEKLDIPRDGFKIYGVCSDHDGGNVYCELYIAYEKLQKSNQTTNYYKKLGK